MPFETNRHQVVAVIVQGSVLVFEDHRVPGELHRPYQRCSPRSGSADVNAEETEKLEQQHSNAVHRRNTGDWGELVNTLHTHGVINVNGLSKASNGTNSTTDAIESQGHRDEAFLLVQERAVMAVWQLADVANVLARDSRTRHLSFSYDQTLAFCGKRPAKRTFVECSYVSHRCLHAPLRVLCWHVRLTFTLRVACMSACYGCSYIADVLGQFRSFQLVSRETLLALASFSLQLSTIAAGKVIAKQGEEAGALVVLLSGTAAVCRVENYSSSGQGNGSSKGVIVDEDVEVDEHDDLKGLPSGISSAANSGSVTADPAAIMAIHPTKGVQLPGKLLCKLRALDMCGEETITRSNVGDVGGDKLQAVAQALENRYKSHIYSTRDAAYAEVMRSEALFSKRHGASIVAVTLVEALVITPAQLRQAQEMVENGDTIGFTVATSNAVDPDEADHANAKRHVQRQLNANRRRQQTEHNRYAGTALVWARGSPQHATNCCALCILLLTAWKSCWRCHHHVESLGTLLACCTSPSKSRYAISSSGYRP